MQLTKPTPSKRFKQPTVPSAAIDADLMQINRTDWASTVVLAQALLASELGVFEQTLYELDNNRCPTGFTLPPGRYPFIPQHRVDWDDLGDDAKSIAVFEFAQPGAADAISNTPREFDGRVMVRVQQGFVLLVGAGSHRKVAAWPAKPPRAQTQDHAALLFDDGGTY